MDNKEKIGFDVSEHLSEEIEKLDIKFVNNIEIIAENSIDVVICHHVLEHTDNPSKVLKEIYKILKPSGKLLLFVPLERSRKYNSFNSNEPNKHLFSWNVQTMGKLVEIMDFKVEIAKRQTFGYDRFAANLTKKLGLGESIYRIIRRILLIIKTDYEVFVLAEK